MVLGREELAAACKGANTAEQNGVPMAIIGGVMALLAMLAFGTWVSIDDVAHTGIDKLDLQILKLVNERADAAADRAGRPPAAQGESRHPVQDRLLDPLTFSPCMGHGFARRGG